MAEIYRSASLVLHTMAVKSIGLRTALYGEACVPKKILRKVRAGGALMQNTNCSLVVCA